MSAGKDDLRLLTGRASTAFCGKNAEDIQVRDFFRGSGVLTRSRTTNSGFERSLGFMS